MDFEESVPLALDLLIVEDDIELADCIRESFEIIQDSWGTFVSVQHETKGATAIKYLEQSKYDLIVLDIHLPDVLGTMVYSFCQSTVNKKTPVIMLSGSLNQYRPEYTEERIIYLEKPANEKQLLSNAKFLLKTKLSPNFGAQASKVS